MTFTDDIPKPTILVTLMLLLLSWYIVRKILDYFKSNLPPGPIGLPIVGYLPFLPADVSVCETFRNLAKVYGDIFSIKIGCRKMVILNSAATIHEVLRLNAAAGRVKDSYLSRVLIAAGEDAMLVQDGPKVTLHRNLGLRAIKMFGHPQKPDLDTYVTECLQWLTQKLEDTRGAPVDVADFYMPCTAGISLAIVFGVKPGMGSSSYQHWVKIFKRLVDLAEALDTIEYLPFSRFLYRRQMKETSEFLTRYIVEIAKYDRPETSGVPQGECIGKALQELIESTRPETKRRSETTDSGIRRALIDIFDGSFFAGADVLRWTVVMLVTNQEVQNNLAAEVLAVVGTDKPPSIKLHGKFLHYTRAVFYEVVRYTSFFALALEHRAMEDISVAGYVIPADTTIVPNQWAANHDPDVFPEPDKFSPERFMADGEFNAPAASKVLAFSCGKRRCLGESIAVQDFPILIAGLVQKFVLELDPATVGDPVRNSVFAFTLHPGPHKIIHRPRPSGPIANFH